jgi:hypothetical protein
MLKKAEPLLLPVVTYFKIEPLVLVEERRICRRVLIKQWLYL